LHQEFPSFPTFTLLSLWSVRAAALVQVLCVSSIPFFHQHWVFLAKMHTNAWMMLATFEILMWLLHCLRHGPLIRRYTFMGVKKHLRSRHRWFRFDELCNAPELQWRTIYHGSNSGYSVHHDVFFKETNMFAILWTSRQYFIFSNIIYFLLTHPSIFLQEAWNHRS